MKSGNYTLTRQQLRSLGVPMIAALFVGVVWVATFVEALHNPQPHDVPVGLVAPAPLAQKLEAGLRSKVPGGFSIHRYITAQQARAAIDRHDVDGALVVTDHSAHLYVASAAGMAVTQAIGAASEGIARGAYIRFTVQDLKPLPPDDPRGTIPYYMVFGLLFAGVVFSVLLFVLAHSVGVWPRVAVAIVFAALAGLAATLTAALVAGAQFDNFWQVATLTALLTLAIATTTAAAQRLVGLGGTAFAGLMFILLGNSTSGGTVNYEFLPDVFRQLSQNLPPGAAVTGIRNAAYFDANNLGYPVLILLAWALAGLVIVIAEGLVRPVQAREEGSEGRGVGPTTVGFPLTVQERVPSHVGDPE